MFTIIAVGKLKEKYYADAVDEYVKRISGFYKINIIDVKDNESAETAVLAKIPHNAYVFALCIEGDRLSSEGLSRCLEKIYLSEKKGICFIIGGSEGLSSVIKDKADFRLSMSDMTFPHRLAKVMLLEQLYRVLTLQNNIKYHK